MARGKGSALESFETQRLDGLFRKRWPLCIPWVMAFAVGCTQSASTITGVARSPRGANCGLTLISASDVYPGAKYANAYEVVGMVWVTGKPDARAVDPDVKTEVRPRACAMGGELIALVESIPLWGPAASTTDGSQPSAKLGQRFKFAVYARKVVAVPQKY